MIVKKKAYFLKTEIEVDELEKFGFRAVNSDKYCRDTKKDLYISCYRETRVFKIEFWSGWWQFVRKHHIKDLIENGIVEKRIYVYGVFWNFRNFSDAKKERITNKRNKLQEKIR